MAAPAPARGLAFLPSELLKLIFDHLQQDSLLQVRLTCKALSPHATPGAFTRITVWLEKGRLSDIVKIAEQPHLAPYVRQIACGMQEFCNLSFDHFRMDVYPNRMKEGITAGTVKDLKASWQVYQSYAVKQRHLDSSGQGHTMLCECFKAFPNLDAVEIHGGDSDWRDPEHGSKLLRLEPRLRHHMLFFFHPSLVLSRGMRQMSTMVKALAHTGKPIEHLYLHPFDFEFDGGGLLAPLKPSEEKLALAAFVGLKSLDLDLYNLSDARCTTPKYESSSLSTIFQAAVGLKSLRVNVRSLNLVSKWTGLFTGTFGPGGPRQLETLVIEEAMLDQTEFVEIMRETGHNLHSLTINHANVYHGSSTAIFDAIRSLPELTRVEFSTWDYLRAPPIIICGTSNGGRIDDADAQPLYDYLLRNFEISPNQSLRTYE